MTDTDKQPRTGPFAFGPVNYALILAGVAAAIFGYVLLNRGSVTAAPILLILGYAVLLPAGIMVGWKSLGAGDEVAED